MPENTMTRRVARTAAAALTAASLVALAGTATTAQADGKDAHTGAKGTHAGKHAIHVLYLKFVKNKQDHTDSRLYVVRDGSVVKSYRAGSGKGPYATKECRPSQGWLPSGDYSVKGYEKKHNGDIKGYAVALSDAKCDDGKTWRRELFIHSEMTRDGGRGGPESQRWDGVKDYNSNGCIKLRPDHIKDMYGWFEKNGWPRTLKVVG
ncbi:L,D-transpeptidase [Streptomyces abikoensis]|uniref:L,D-transpeptidase n=1 Tax=Streptomyces abikoensis TaxID=97398 RepID=A0ABW7T4N3_9ACTN